MILFQIYKMTLRLSALFEARCETVQNAYNLSSTDSVHMTRRRTKTLNKTKEEIDADQLSSSSLVSRKLPRRQLNGSYNATGEDSISSTRSETKVVVKVEDIRKPATRSRRQSSEEVPNCNGKNKRARLKTESSEHSSSSETEEEIIEEESSNDSSHDEAPAENKSPKKSAKVTNSGRTIFKRARYGFDSEENDEEMKPVIKKKKITNGKQPKKKLTPTSSKRPLRNDSVQRRPARSKAAVSYCEDDDYENFDDAFEPEEQSSVKNNESSSSSSSSDEGEAVSSEEEDENIPVAGVSSRGRIRRPANRFLEY